MAISPNMMQESLLDGRQHSKRAYGAVKWLAPGLAGVLFVGFAFYSTGPVPLTSGLASLATGGPAVEWLEARAGGWNTAANQIVAKLKAAGVKRGQIISIDAHNNGPDGDAIFSAHFVRTWPDNGPLDITYRAQNSNYGWDTFYSNAAVEVDETDVISITASSNTNGKAVMYTFLYAPPATRKVVRNLGYVESRSGSWNGAADGLIAKLKANNVQRGQVVSIDAHNNGPTGDAIFCAFYDLGKPAYTGGVAQEGGLEISYTARNTQLSWGAHYNNAALTATTGVISITSAMNSGGNSVTYVFNYV